MDGYLDPRKEQDYIDGRNDYWFEEDLTFGEIIALGMSPLYRLGYYDAYMEDSLIHYFANCLPVCYTK